MEEIEVSGDRVAKPVQTRNDAVLLVVGRTRRAAEEVGGASLARNSDVDQAEQCRTVQFTSDNFSKKC